MFNPFNIFKKKQTVIAPPLSDSQRIYALTETHKNVCISIGDYCNFLKPEWDGVIDPITERSTLLRGLYCNIGTCNVWVSYIVGPGHFRVSEEDILDAIQDKKKWSPEIPLHLFDKIDRVLKLKSFW